MEGQIGKAQWKDQDQRRLPSRKERSCDGRDAKADYRTEGKEQTDKTNSMRAKQAQEP